MLFSTFPLYSVFHTGYETKSTLFPCYEITENKEEVYS
jgi:hypothetical protein